MGNRTHHTGSTVLMAKSYKMRMYQRRLWQERATIVLTTVGLWLTLVTIIIVLAEVTG
jgi:hypothetical protein